MSGDRNRQRFVGRSVAAHADLVDDSFAQPSENRNGASLPFVATTQDGRRPPGNSVFTKRALRRTPHRREYVPR